MQFYSKLTLLLTILFCSNSFAQEIKLFNIKGKVVSPDEENSPLPSANIKLLDKDSTLITGSKSSISGDFSINQVPSGNYILNISYVGYQPFNLPIGSNNIENLDLGNIKLIASASLSDEVIIKADKDLISYQLDKKIIDIKQIISAKGGTLLDAMKEVPSVNVDIEGNVTIKGSSNFQILVDGKPSQLSAKDLFQQIPFDAVENLELMTNPSAKYASDGQSGILNVITKKEKNIGFSSLVNASSSTRDKYSFSFNSTVNTEKFKNLLTVSTNQYNDHPINDYKIENYRGDSIFYANSYSDRRHFSDGYNIGLNTDYVIDTNSVLTGNFKIGGFGFDRIMPVNYTNYDNYNSQKTYSIFDDRMDLSGQWLNTFFDYTYNFTKESNLKSFVMYSYWFADVAQVSSNVSTNSNFKEILNINEQKSTTNNANGNFIQFKSDYTNQINPENRLEMGFLAENNIKNGNFRYFNKINGEDILNNQFSNLFQYSHNLSAAYATYSHNLYDFNILYGLRGEYYDRIVDQKTLDIKNNYSQFSLFPTLHISRKLGDYTDLQFSYSRRVHRPDHRALNPFPDYVDNFYISKGNPDLKPHFSDSYQLNFKTNFGPVYFFAESFFLMNYDIVAQGSFPQEDGKVLLMQVNQGDDKAYGVEFNLNYNPIESIRLNLSTNSYNRELNDVSSGSLVKRYLIEGNARLNTTFILPEAMFLQISLFYNSPTMQVNGFSEEYYSANFAFKKDFFNQKLSVSLSAANPFGITKTLFNSQNSLFKSYGYYAQEANVVRLNISYSINNFDKRKLSGDGGFQGGV